MTANPLEDIRWQARLLAELVDFQRGLTYKKSDEVPFSGNAVLRANNIDRLTGLLNLDEIRYIRDDVEVHDRLKVRPGTLLICTASGSKSHLGKVALVEEAMDFAFGGFMGLIIPKPGLNPRYLFYVTRSSLYDEFIDSLSDGANINNLKFSDLSKFAVPLPPLEEQKRIVAVLDQAFAALDRARALAEANLADAGELFEATKRHFSSLGADQATTASLGEVVSIAAKLVDPKLPANLDLPHIGAGNMVTGTDDLFDIQTAREEGLKSGKFPFAAGVVLYSKIRPYLRKVARPDFDGLCSADVYPLTPSKHLDRDYLFHLLLSEDFTAYAIAGSARAGMPKVNQEHLFAYRFDLPPVEAQRVIARSIDAALVSRKQLENISESKLVQLADLRQALLQKAFAGELT